MIKKSLEYNLEKYELGIIYDQIMFICRARNRVDIKYEHKLAITDTVYYGECSIELGKQRIDLLKSMATDMEIGIMAIRYASIIMTTQHWSVPTMVYKRLVEKYDINCEGFSSPINSQLLKLSRPFEYWDYKGGKHKSAAVIGKPSICTLFGDTDKPFGSIGSFFTADLVGRRLTCFIPYISGLMERIVDKIIDTMEDSEKQKKKTLIIYGGPLWYDDDWYHRLQNYRFVKKSQILKDGDYWFEFRDEKMRTNFGTVYNFIANYDIPEEGMVYK